MVAMSEKALLRIGEFSRASWLSVKALRAYHESGLLVPADVDPSTGYRSYTVAQLTDAAIIRRLRALDLPLEAVRSVLDARDPDVTRKVLAEHGAVLEERLASTQRAIDELTRAVESPSSHTPVHRRADPGATVLACDATVAEVEWEPFLERARRLLVDAAVASGAVVDGAFGGCYPPPLDEDAQEVVAFLPVRAAPLLPAPWRAEGVRVDALSATDVAVLSHFGAYDGLEDTYRELGAWVGANADPTGEAVREHYLVGPADTDDPHEYRTELRWPVRPSA
jgi:DNA-binding transcriptional MerR regulator